jgi:5-formyltetrahydrofolate cyclo-ligase
VTDTAAGDPGELAERKAQQRGEARGRRKALDVSYRSAASKLISSRIIASEHFERASIIASYEWMHSEVQTSALNAAAAGKGTVLIVPEVLGPESMRFVRSDARDVAVDLSVADLIIVPAVGFDLGGNRLGNGRGYYDRALASVGGLKVCVAFDAQRLDALVIDSTDVPMDVIVTESGVVFGADRWSQ